jgi:hypothetical protein
VFRGSRRETFSQAIFIGNGGPLQTVTDAAASGFSAFGNCDINDSGTIVFTGFVAPEGTEAIFLQAGNNIMTSLARTGFKCT